MQSSRSGSPQATFTLTLMIPAAAPTDRGAAVGALRPGDPAANKLFLLAINLTKRCNLACAHCYMDAQTLKRGGSDELATAEVRDLLDEVASRSTETMVVLTGGEPVLRADLGEFLVHGSEIGFSMEGGTKGGALTGQRREHV